MASPVDHTERLALITAFCRSRSQARAARTLYDQTVLLPEGATDPASHVVAACRSVFALHEAKAITDRRAEIALASLLTAFQSVRSLGGEVRHADAA